jgi:hypothetical protein
MPTVVMTSTGPVGDYPSRRRPLKITAMSKRILAAILWFYTGWYAGAFIAEFLGISPLFGPIVGAAAAALIAGDPRRIIWKRPTRAVDPTATVEGLPEPV